MRSGSGTQGDSGDVHLGFWESDIMEHHEKCWTVVSSQGPSWPTGGNDTYPIGDGYPIGSPVMALATPH